MTCVSCAKEIAEGAVICPHCRAPQRTAPADLGAGTHIERGATRIVVEKKIGSGAMGNVFRGWLFFAPDGPRAKDPPELVALKQLKREVRSSEDMRTLFSNEAQALSLLSHPNVVRFLDLFEWTPPPARARTAPVPISAPPGSLPQKKKGGPALTLVMEFVEGDSLAEVIARNVARARLAGTAGCLQPARAYQYFEQLVSALAAAHARGIIHRDVKPSNTMIRKDGLVKLTDFGIAYFRVERPGVDNSGALAPGTGAYMSPEQVMGHPLDGRSDFYAAAIVLYEMLCGRPPFAPDEDKPELALRVDQVETTPPKISTFLPHAPAPLDLFFSRALAKSPAHRFQNATELVQAASNAMGFMPSAAWAHARELADAAAHRTPMGDARVAELRGAVENGYRTQAFAMPIMRSVLQR